MVENLDELIADLNTSNSLSLFVRAVRKAWRIQVPLQGYPPHS